MSGYAVGHVLRTSKAYGTSLLVLIVIAEATHQDGRGAWPSIDSIAKLARTSPRNVTRVIGELERSGELVVERGVGPHGTNMYSVPGVGQMRLGDALPVTPDTVSGDAAVSPDTTSPRRRRRRPLTTAPVPLTTAAAGGDIALSPEPSYPVLEPVEEPSRAARARGIEIPTRPPTVAEVRREEQRFGKLAEEVWLETAPKVGSPYTDRLALRTVHHQAIAALRWADERQILAAIRRRMDGKSSPRRIPEWARLEAGRDQELAHMQRRDLEHADEVIEERTPGAGLHHIGGAAAAAIAKAAS